MSEIQEGKAAIVTLPGRGRTADPIPDKEVKMVLDNLGQLEKGQGATNGRFFTKKHQAQAYGRRLLDQIVETDGQYSREALGTSVRPVDDTKTDESGKPVGPFFVAVRKVK